MHPGYCRMGKFVSSNKKQFTGMSVFDHRYFPLNFAQSVQCVICICYELTKLDATVVTFRGEQ
jgi:hypothetical protein